MRVRFAPSPTGNLHLGTLRTALFNWLLAKHHGGTMVLRTEDTDLKRSKPEFETSILEGLDWVGIGYDEGPNKEGAYGPYRQSERIEAGIYDKVAQQLLDEGKAYRCFCTDEELDAERKAAEEKGIPYVYSQRSKHLSADEIQANLDNKVPYTLRFEMPKTSLTYHDLIRGDITFDLSLISDFVIVKSDGTPSYNFAVVVDDAQMAITHVVRGEDHISNTPRQLALFEALGLQAPAYAHMPMILGADKSKLSKRHGATNVVDYREQGYLSDALFNYMTLLGWSSKDGQELLSRDELIQQFDLDRVGKSGSVFDMTKLTWMNGQYIRALAPEALVEAVTPYLSDDTNTRLADYSPELVQTMIVAVKDNLDVLADINTYLAVFLTSFDDFKAKLADTQFDEATKAIFTLAKSEIEALPEAATEADFAGFKDRMLEKTGLGMGKVFKPLRQAVSGDQKGPHILTLLAVLGKAKLLERLTYSLAR